MITFVYCCVCLLIVCCQTAKIESEESDFNNDSPDVWPTVTVLKHKLGADVDIKCRKHYYNQDITWEFKQCDNHHSFQCDSESIYKLEGQWKKLDYNRRRKKLEIKNATEDDSGLYRCLYDGTIMEIYRLDIIVPVRLLHPPPRISSFLASSNYTIVTHTSMVFQCKAESEVAPAIRWLKEGHSCPIPYEGRYYCTLPNSTFAAINHNTYMSKLSIDAAKETDSGTYVCLVMTEFGEDHQNVTITVWDVGSEDSSNSFSLLFLIPLFFVLVPIIIWFGFYRGKNHRRPNYEHQKQLIKPAVQV